MTTLPEEAVKAYIKAFGNTPRTKAMALKNEQKVRHALTAALPFLPVQGAVNIDAIVQPLEDIHAPGGLCRWTDVATAIGEVRRALSALEPSAARELALEEEFATIRAMIYCYEGDSAQAFEAQKALAKIDSAIRTLSSPDHADAGKVEGDGRADLERFWRPISEADKSITFEQTFDTGDGKSMTIRNSDHYWVRDADGRVYEATWSDHKGGYWWDLEGESPVDPVEYMPHPPSLRSAPASEKEKS